MTAIDRMRAELETISGSAQAARTITQHTIHRYLWDSTELHNTGHRVRGDWGLPAEDLPDQLLSPQSIYRLTPTTEAIATAVAAQCRPEPVHRWELPAPERDDESERAWNEEGMATAVDPDPDYGKDLDDEEGPF